MKIKNIYYLLIIYPLISLVLPGCNNSNESFKKQVTVSIQPQKFFVEKIAGGFFSVNVMVEEGNSPATYDPTPSQLKKLDYSIIYFQIGHLGFEENWTKKIIELFPDLKVVDLSEGLTLIGSHSHHGHQHGADPHTWLSFQNVRTMANKIYEELAQLEPDKETEFQENLETFLNEINSLQTIAKKEFADIQTNTFIIYHPALTYLAEEFDLHQVSIEFEGKNPSPKSLASVIDLAKSDGINRIFIQKEFDMNFAESVASEISAEIIQINPLSYQWDSTMYNITLELSKSMK